MNIKAYGPILMVGFFAGLIGGIASGSRPSLAQQIPPTIQAQTIQAQNIEVLDRSGKLRMRLASNPQTGAAGVSIFDASNGTARIIIGALVDGTSDIQIMDANGNRRASLDFMQGTARLALANTGSKGGVVLGADDRSALLFTDSNQKSRAAFGLDPTGQPALTIYDGASNVVWSAPPQPRN